MIVEFDPEHIRRIQDRDTYVTYLGCRIQNELIQMLADEVSKKIIAKVKCANYFSVILDCTPDVSHKERISLTIRCLDDSQSSMGAFFRSGRHFRFRTSYTPSKYFDYSWA